MHATPIGPSTVSALPVGCAPLQPSEPGPPVAVQAVPFLVDQVSVVDCPVGIAAGASAKLPIVAGGGVLPAVTVTDVGELVPPGPVQVRV